MKDQEQKYEENLFNLIQNNDKIQFQINNYSMVKFNLMSKLKCI